MNKEWIESTIQELEQLIENVSTLLERIPFGTESYVRNYDRRADYYKALHIAKGML